MLRLIIVQRPEIKSRAFSTQSPMIFPRYYPESPAPVPSLYNQFEDGYNFMERRRSSIANEGDFFGMRRVTEDQAEMARVMMPRRGSIIPFDLDGFKRPKEPRADLEENPKMVHRETSSIPIKLISPAIQPDERKEAFRSLAPLNAAYSPMVIKTPLLSPLDNVQWLQPALYTYPAEPVRKNSEYGLRLPNPPEDGLQPNYLVSPFIQPSPQQMQGQCYVQQDNFRLDAVEANNKFNSGLAIPEPMIGTLTVTQRKEKIRKYREKRKQRIWKKKVSYDCRKKVADKRLRIKGRFVTREQACAILGTTPEDLAGNELLRTLIINNDNCSIVTSAQNMKIRNLQTLFTASERAKDKNVKDDKGLELKKNVEDNGKTPNGLKVEILKNNPRDQVVEIKIEPLAKNSEDNTNQGQYEIQQKKDERLPKINSPIFQFKRLKAEELKLEHRKYHKEVN